MKTLPHDHQLEKSILGHCLVEAEHFMYCVASIDESYFSHPTYKAAWQSMVELNNEGIEPDALLVKQRMGEILKQQPQELTKDIIAITSGLPFPNMESWVKYAKSLRDSRSFIELCDKYSELAYVEKPEIVMEDFHMEFIEIGATKSGLISTTAADRIDKAIAKIEKGMNNSGISGIPVGLEALDYVMGGLQTGLHVVAGRPGDGKTEVSMFIAKNAASHSPGYMAQLEMSGDQSTFRQLTSMSGIRYSKMQRSEITAYELSVLKTWAEKLKGVPLFLDVQSGLSITQIVARVKYYHKKEGIRWAIIDYVQIMDIEQSRNQTRDQAIGIVTRALKGLANELDIPIILLSQLGRITDTHPFGRPLLGDLRESGNIENDADTVILLYYAEKFRDQYESFVEDNSGLPLDEIIEFIFAKNRAGTPNLSTFARWRRGLVSYIDEPLMNAGISPPQTPSHEDQF